MRESEAKVGQRCGTDHLLPEFSEAWEEILEKVEAYTCYKANHSVQNAQLEKAHNTNVR